jgi:hypothetical protein
MTIPRFATVGLESTDDHTENARLAATIYAFDVPLDPVQPWSVITGDGIKGSRVVWHFRPEPDGNQPGEIAKRWNDGAWLANNPENPLAIIREAFEIYAKMTNCIRLGRGFSHFGGMATTIHTTRIAAILAALGHPVLGWVRGDRGTAWKLHPAAAADAALIEREDLYTTLPDEAISYAKGALLGHAYMVDVIKKATTTQHMHRGRIALIGRNCPDANILTLEKLLYRK